MDANIFIKSFKTEGNRITDIKFNGDWNIDITNGAPDGSGSGGITQTIPMESNILPFGVYMEAEKTTTQFKVTVKNEGSMDYKIGIAIPGNTFQLDDEAMNKYDLPHSSQFEYSLSSGMNAIHIIFYTTDYSSIVGICSARR